MILTVPSKPSHFMIQWNKKLKLTECCISISRIQKKKKKKTSLLPILNEKTKKNWKQNRNKETATVISPYPLSFHKAELLLLLYAINIRIMRQVGMRWCWLYQPESCGSSKAYLPSFLVSIVWGRIFVISSPQQPSLSRL